MKQQQENITFRLDSRIKNLIIERVTESTAWQLEGVHNISTFLRYIVLKEIKTWSTNPPKEDKADQLF